MSAFVVQDKTINRVIHALATDYNGYFGYVSRKIGGAVKVPIGYNHIHLIDDEWEQKLGQAMFALNCDAVNQRYGPDQAQEFRPLDYKWQSEPCTLMQSYKALQCWHYQCSEGNVPDTSELYKAMEDLCNVMAHHLVSAMPAYETAGWDAA